MAIPKTEIPALSRIRHKVRPLPRVPLRDIHKPEYADYLTGKRL